MTQSTVCRSFAEVAAALGYDDLTGSPAVEAGDTTADGGAADLSALLAVLESAGAALAAARRQEDRARDLALEALATHDRLATALAGAEAALARGRVLRADAEALAAEAFDADARATADRVVREASAAEAATERLVGARRAALASFAAEHDLARLRADRRRREEAENARAARALRAERLAGALSRARQALAAGRWEEARDVLAPALDENPGNPEAVSLHAMIARRALERKAVLAEDALGLARRDARRAPAGAVARLAALDVDGLPSPLAGQVFGCWSDACARLCRERGLAGPLRFSPAPGRGAVLARRGDGPLEVVSALGLPWRAGDAPPDVVAARARPLR